MIVSAGTAAPASSAAAPAPSSGEDTVVLLHKRKARQTIHSVDQPRDRPQAPQRSRFQQHQEQPEQQLELSSIRTLDETFALGDIADANREQQQHDPTDVVAVEGRQQPPLLDPWSPFYGAGSPTNRGCDDGATELVDLRLQMQASKLAFIVEKRRKELVQIGFMLRREEATVGTAINTIQEFLDRTRVGRDVSSQGFAPVASGGRNMEYPLPSGCERDGPAALLISALREECSMKLESGGDGGGCGGNSDRAARDFFRSSGGFEAWRDMTFVFCEELGWVFLHQATQEAVAFVKDMVEAVHCQEMGVVMADPGNKATIEGLASAFSSCDDVSVRIHGAIAKIAGTEEQVLHVSRAIEAIDGSAQRLHSAGEWYYEGSLLMEPATTAPWFPMAPATSNGLEEAFMLWTGSNGSSSFLCVVGGDLYQFNFTLMMQRNDTTGSVRRIKRVITDRRSSPLPRCPKVNIPLIALREGSTFTLVNVSQADEMMVRAAVTLTYVASEVERVQHIWNPFLWGHYAQNAKSIGNENMLFHGAPPHSLNDIMRTGFERRLAGSKNGVNYGQGCYFARDALLASFYMDPPPCGGQMIMAKVLVGEHTLGHWSMVVPPKMPASERQYDTTADDFITPSTFVTYKDWQAYPMYLITFAPRPWANCYHN